MSARSRASDVCSSCTITQANCCLSWELLLLPLAANEDADEDEDEGAEAEAEAEGRAFAPWGGSPEFAAAATEGEERGRTEKEDGDDDEDDEEEGNNDKEDDDDEEEGSNDAADEEEGDAGDGDNDDGNGNRVASPATVLDVSSVEELKAAAPACALAAPHKRPCPCPLCPAGLRRFGEAAPS